MVCLSAMTHLVARLCDVYYACACVCPETALNASDDGSSSPKRTLFVELSGLFNFVFCHCSVVVLSLLSLFLSTQVRAYLP